MKLFFRVEFENDENDARQQMKENMMNLAKDLESRGHEVEIESVTNDDVVIEYSKRVTDEPVSFSLTDVQRLYIIVDAAHRACVQAADKVSDDEIQDELQRLMVESLEARSLLEKKLGVEK